MKFLKYAEINHRFFLNKNHNNKLNITIIDKNKLREKAKLKLETILVILLADSKKSRLFILIKSIILSIYSIGTTLNAHEKIQIKNLFLLSFCSFKFEKT